ncbi:membrane hypothetical protein [Thiomonas delicata]|uniref:ABC transmembrane type-1 domain-containing protein n=1 Tax=Thiomonas delicata TaxID=364030 RepID=A0A238D1I1_THIDL|nr:membrane hypothetical protein [Thiomonas delicata]
MAQAASSRPDHSRGAWALYWRAFGVVRRHDARIVMHFALASVLLLCIAGLNAAWPYFLRELTNKLAPASLATVSSAAATALVLAFAGCWMLARVAEWAKHAAFAAIAARCDAAFQQALYMHLLRWPYAEFLRHDRGVLIGDIQNSRRAFSDLSFVFFWTVGPIVVELLMVGAILTRTVSGGFAAAFLVRLLAAFALAVAIATRTQSGHAEMIAASNALTAQMVEKFGAMLDIKVNAAYAQERAFVGRTLRRYVDVSARGNALFAFYLSMQSLAVGFILLGSSLYLAQQVLGGSFSSGDFVMVTGYVLQLTMPFTVLAGVLIGVRRAVSPISTSPRSGAARCARFIRSGGWRVRAARRGVRPRWPGARHGTQPEPGRRAQLCHRRSLGGGQDHLSLSAGRPALAEFGPGDASRAADRGLCAGRGAEPDRLRAAAARHRERHGARQPAVWLPAPG